MERRKINVEKPTIRRELEMYISAFNKYLKDVVGSMDIIILLRNAYPTYRSDYASQLYKEGSITKDQAKEFVKFV